MTMAAPSRHPGLDAHCADLNAIHASQAVSTLTDDELNKPGSLCVLPMFCWTDLGDDVGKKNLSTDGDERWLMPVRIKWDSHPVIRLSNGGQLTIGYRIDAPGLCESGEVTVAATTGRTESAELDPRRQKLWVVEELATQDSHRQADHIREAGHKAYWRRLLHFSEYAEKRISISHSKMRKEISATLRLWADEWVDDAAREAILQRMILGEDGEESTVQRMLNAQIHRDDIFDRVDPHRHAASFIKRAANEQIYSAISDPREGPHIRAAAAEAQVFDAGKLKTILDAEPGPAAGLHVDTVSQALNPIPYSSVKDVKFEEVTGDATSDPSVRKVT